MAVKNSDVSLVFNGLKLLITLRYYKHLELNISISKNYKCNCEHTSSAVCTKFAETLLTVLRV